jgi:dolichyl-diphosphooligosaccharide--protein glycosyltransferase
MARIAGSVYPDVRQEGFYVDERGNPSDTMRESLLYRLHSYGRDTEIEPLEHYEEVYQSKHSMVRIWKVLDVDVESKGAFLHWSPYDRVGAVNADP